MTRSCASSSARSRSDVHVRGNEITITGAPAENASAERLFTELLELIEKGETLTSDAVRRTVGMLEQDSAERPAEVLTLNILSRRGRTIRPKTLGQKRYVDAIDAHTIVFGIGPAGTGKTYLAMAKAVQALQAKQVNRIILTRPAVEAGERLGFLPGTLNEKIDPYLRPLYDALHDMLDPESIPRLMAAGTIEVAPLAYMRGRTLNDAFIILDEAQNTTPEQMKMFLTRLGFGSKIVVTGDITQVDLPGGTTSGLRVVREILQNVEDVHFAAALQRRRRPPPAGRGDRRRVRPLGRRPGEPAGASRCTPRRDAPPRPAGPAGTARPSREETSCPSRSPTSPASTVDTDAVLAVARYALDEMGVNPLAELSVLLVDIDYMTELNHRWMGGDGPTDVLAFPMDEGSVDHGPGESTPVASRPCSATSCSARRSRPSRPSTAGHSAADELHLLTVHGVLHLLGYDHAEPEEEREMFALQARLLTSWQAGTAAS